jgi:tetratricopeptide (TPR) repeat protein
LIAARAYETDGRLEEATREAQTAVDEARRISGPILVEALLQLAGSHVFSGGPEGDPLSAEALALGQQLEVGPDMLAQMFLVRGLAHGFADHYPQAQMYLRETVRQATRAGNDELLARAHLNLSAFNGERDPDDAAASAQIAIQHSRRLGSRLGLSVGTANFAIAMIQLGQLDAAADAIEEVLPVVGDEDRVIAEWQTLLEAIHGRIPQARAGLNRLTAVSDLDPQDRATIALCRAVVAQVQGRSAEALSYAIECFEFAEILGVNCETSRWSWPIAARAAYELGDRAASDDLLKRLADPAIGALPRLIKAERVLATGRLAALDGDPAATAQLAEAVRLLKDVGPPWYLALGLCDHARQLLAEGKAAAAAEDLEEADQVAGELSTPWLSERIAVVRADAAHD